MKKLNVLKASNLIPLSLILVTGLFFANCKKDSGGSNTGGGNNSGAMTAKVDGTAWTANTAGASIVNGVMNITGIGGDGSTITMTIQADQEGTYALDFGGQNAGVYMKSGANNSFLSNAHADAGGTVTVTSINSANKTMSGTFSYEGYHPTDMIFINITEGQFTDIPYTTDVGGGSNNSLSADIDGSSWTATAVNGAVALGRLTIVGSDNQGVVSVSVSMPEDVAVGTYDLTFLGDYIGQYNKFSTEFLSSDDGKLNITKHDKSGKKIEGTFNFNASDFNGTLNSAITNGSFVVSY